MKENDSFLNVGAEAAEIKGIINKYAKSVDDADTDLASEIWSNTNLTSNIVL